MKHKQLIWGIFAFFGILILILDSKTALAGAQEGIVLCIKTAIPSLFPFFVLSNLLTGSLYGIRFAILRPFAKLLSIPAGCEILLISGFLGGYPTGAQAIMQAYQGKQLSKPEAERLLAYGSNAGPSFLFGITAQFFPETWMVWALWMIHVLSAVLTAQQFSFHTSSAALSIQRKEMTISAALKNALRAMELVCGWIVFFRSLIYIFKKWLLWMLPECVQVFVIGILELTNGCIELNTISGTSERFILCSCLLAFGGVCVLLQTAAVTQGLSLRFYLSGKLWQTLFSLILSCCLMYRLRFPALILFVLILLQKRKKVVAFRIWLVYNSTNKARRKSEMLFRKKIERSCSYCRYGGQLEDGQVLCIKKGMKSSEDKCRKFKYDPCKRFPVKAKALDFTRYEQEDFSL